MNCMQVPVRPSLVPVMGYTPAPVPVWPQPTPAAAAVCTTPACGRFTYNGHVGQPCLHCYQLTPGCPAICGCGKPTYNKQWGHKCSRGCTAPPLPGPTAAPPLAPVVRGPFCGCGKPTWNGQWMELCRKGCIGPKLAGPAAGGGAHCGCGKPTFNGQWQELCAKSCKGPKVASPIAGKSHVPSPICSIPACAKPTFDGKPGFCSKTCKAAGVGHSAASAGPYCHGFGCKKPTFDGKPGFCGKVCRRFGQCAPLEWPLASKPVGDAAKNNLGLFNGHLVQCCKKDKNHVLPCACDPSLYSLPEYEGGFLPLDQQNQLHLLTHSLLWNMLPDATKSIATYMAGQGPWYFGGTAGANFYITACTDWDLHTGNPPIPTNDWDLRLKVHPPAPAPPPKFVKDLADALCKLVDKHMNAMAASDWAACPSAKSLGIKFGPAKYIEDWGCRLSVDFTVGGQTKSWKFCDLSTKWESYHKDYEKSLHICATDCGPRDAGGNHVWAKGMSFMGPQDVENDLHKTWQPRKKTRRQKALAYWKQLGGAAHFAKHMP